MSADRRTSRLLGALPTLLVVAGAFALGIRERTTFADAGDLVTRSDVTMWIAAFGALVAGRGALAGTSFVVATRRLAEAPSGAAALAWMRSAVAKYVPGVIWYPLTAVDRLRRHGVGGHRAAAAFYVDAVGSIIAAVIIGGIALPAFVAAKASTAAWLLLAIPAALSLHPRVFAFALRTIGRLMRRPIDDVALDWHTVAVVVVLHIGSWLCAGVALQLLLRALDTDASWSLVLAATALSWAAGLLAVPIPAGLGIREAALIALLVGEIPATTAVAVALGSRVLFVLLDVTCLVASFAASAFVTKPSATTNTVRRSAPG